ncbi:signal peptidase II [Fodinibius sp.]|uniref:signal peptidase II n=1 Tax=Fodinibius sp. TaxID=1872440 RepID=UPI002ACE591D|nr:signal peptidase II [Fodinibius sp.]MDZ7658686.1 signal peptidase II [Fodinibius sp.]
MDRSKITALSVPALIVIVLDQFSKHWIRLNPQWHYADLIPGWLTFNYTQNPGMALGMRWASTEVISGIAILATIAILSYVLYNREDATVGYLLCMGLILGGAIGNIIDRLIMGYIESYGGLLEGHVIDFIHFNLSISGYPVFPYIFNVADVAISTAIIAMLVFHKRIVPQNLSGSKQQEQPREERKADTQPTAEG